MNTFYKQIFFFVFLTSIQSKEEVEKIHPYDITQLTTAINEEQYFFVLFTRSNCSQCDIYSTTYQEAAEYLYHGAPGYPAVTLGKVNMDHEGNRAKDFNIQGYPTLRLYINGTGIEYTGELNRQGMQTWVEQRSGLYINELESEVYVHHYGDTYNHSILYIHPAPVKLPGEKKYQQDPNLWMIKDVARLFKGNLAVGFAHTKFEDKVREVHNVPQDVQVILWRKRDNSKHFYWGEINPLRLYNFIKDLQRVNSYVLNEKTMDQMFYKDEEKLPTVLLLNQGQERYSLTDDYLTKVNFVFGDTPQDKEDQFWNKLIKFFGLSNNNPGSVLIFYNHQTKLRYIEQGRFQDNEIKNLIDKFLNNQLKPYYRSQYKPEQEEVDGVLQIVGSQFRNIISESYTQNRPILILWSAPWCQHTQIFKESYVKLAYAFKNLIKFAEIDGSLNDVEGHIITYLPTIKLYQPTQNEFIEFQSSLNSEKLLKFLNKNLKSKIRIVEDL